jgi:uncharacterized membrane protein
MKNWKTTLSGILAVAPQVLQVIGVAIPEPISKLILAIFGIAGFYFAKDKDVTGV